MENEKPKIDYYGSIYMNGIEAGKLVTPITAYDDGRFVDDDDTCDRHTPDWRDGIVETSKTEN